MKRVKVPNPSGEGARDGYLAAPGLAVVKAHRYWDVAHVASGYSVPQLPTFERRKDAAHFADVISPLLDWTLPREALAKTIDAAAALRFREVVGDARRRLETERIRQRPARGDDFILSSALRRADERGHDVLLNVSTLSALVGTCARCGADLRCNYEYVGQGRYRDGDGDDVFGLAVEQDCPVEVTR